jgi:hypothetical protein
MDKKKQNTNISSINITMKKSKNNFDKEMKEANDVFKQFESAMKQQRKQKHLQQHLQMQQQQKQFESSVNQKQIQKSLTPTPATTITQVTKKRKTIDNKRAALALSIVNNKKI